MSTVKIIASWIEGVEPLDRWRVQIKAVMHPKEMQSTLNAMAGSMSEIAWREMVEKSFEEPGK